MLNQKTIGDFGTTVTLSDCGEYADIAVETEYGRMAMLISTLEARQIAAWLKTWETQRRQLAERQVKHAD